MLETVVGNCIKDSVFIDPAARLLRRVQRGHDFLLPHPMWGVRRLARLQNWYSMDKYRRVIWQCNAKFKRKKHCRTPHLTEDEIRAAFVRVANRIIDNQEMILEELREDQAMLTGTEELEKEQKQLAEQMNVDTDAVQELIAQNARVAQDQAEYAVRYEALSTRFNETRDKYDAVTAEIARRGIRRRELGRFIRQVEELPDMIKGFDEALWGGLVDHLTVYSKDNIVFTLTSGIEIKA